MLKSVLNSKSKQFQFYYDEPNKIFYRVLTDTVTIENLLDSWYDIFEQGLIPDELNGIVLDYRGAHFNMSIEATDTFSTFFDEHYHFFENKKIALIMTDPDQIVFPLLIQAKNDSYTAQIFSTEEAALQWIEANNNGSF
jgi:hypothetical protein